MIMSSLALRILPWTFRWQSQPPVVTTTTICFLILLSRVVLPWSCLFVQAIVGGTDAPLNRYNWYVRGYTEPPAVAHPCSGGALIARDFVLMPYYNECFEYWRAERVQMDVGAYCRHQGGRNCGQAQYSFSAGSWKIFHHPLYPSMSKVYFRFTLLQLPSLLPESVQPAVPDDGTGTAELRAMAGIGGIHDAFVTAVGLGKHHGFFQGWPNTLQHKESVKYIPPGVCALEWGSVPSHLTPIDYTVCTAGPSFCVMDFGSSVVLPGRGRNGQDVVIGMVAGNWTDSTDAEQCAASASASTASTRPDTLPAIAPSFLWIRKIVCVHSQDPPYWCDQDVPVVSSSSSSSSSQEEKESHHHDNGILASDSGNKKKAKSVSFCEQDDKTNVTLTLKRSCKWLRRRSTKRPWMVREFCSSPRVARACPVTCQTPRKKCND